MHVRFALLLLGLLLAAVPVWGQQTSDVVAQWREGQLRAVRSVGSIRCVEESNRRIDSPHRTKEIYTFSHLHVVPGRPHIRREVERVEINDRPVPEDERRRLTRYLEHGPRGDHERGSDLDRVANLLFWPARFAFELRAEGPLRPDPLVGGALRLDLLGAREHPVERLTLWFAPRGERLLRSRLLARHRPDDAPMTVETEYRRLQGLDVPGERRVEGTMTVRKRSRTYTMRYEQQIAYRDYRFER